MVSKGPASNLRQTPGRHANKANSRSLSETDKSNDQVGEELQLLYEDCEENNFKKTKKRRPTRKKAISQYDSRTQPSVADFLKTRSLTVIEIEGYDTDPGITHDKNKERRRRLSESELMTENELYFPQNQCMHSRYHDIGSCLFIANEH